MDNNSLFKGEDDMNTDSFYQGQLSDDKDTDESEDGVLYDEELWEEDFDDESEDEDWDEDEDGWEDELDEYEEERAMRRSMREETYYALTDGEEGDFSEWDGDIDHLMDCLGY